MVPRSGGRGRARSVSMLLFRLHPLAMPSPFTFSDELRSAGDTPVRVMARLRVLTAEEGGRSTPFTGAYRPNHNFGAPENRRFYIGQVEVPAGEWIHPGETRDLVITFLNVVGLAGQLTPGREWRIQEGPRLVARAELLSVLPS